MELRREVEVSLGTGRREPVKGGGRGHMRPQGERVGRKKQDPDSRV